MDRILITGGNEGIGYHMVLQLLEDGRRVAALDLRIDHLTELKERFADRLLPLAGDVSDEAAVDRCAAEAAAAWGGIDGAVHNACLCPFTGFEQTAPDDFRRVLDVNFLGAVHMTRAVLPFMKQQKAGRIFFTSSGVGVTGFGGIGAYAASKGALESLAKCLNIEYTGSGISFHIIHPPLTRTTSASPLPVPDEFKADPEKVGRDLARNLGKNKWIICHSFAQRAQTRMTYLFPIPMGKLLSKMTDGLPSKDRPRG